ncbi:hypothetical protein BC629DRAFT_1485818 [Irpex lacteus]|nr:hypothetical protein BC629DRAFT_1485818 [Irpex lacteus]
MLRELSTLSTGRRSSETDTHLLDEETTYLITTTIPMNEVSDRPSCDKINTYLRNQRKDSPGQPQPSLQKKSVRPREGKHSPDKPQPSLQKKSILPREGNYSPASPSLQSATESCMLK